MTSLTLNRCATIVKGAESVRILVVGDVILDHFVWGQVNRISPEAPVPVVDLQRESYMAGGAANVARNITSLGARAAIFGAVGRDPSSKKLSSILNADRVDVRGLLTVPQRFTSTKMRIVAGQQQVTRLDRESTESLNPKDTARLLKLFNSQLADANAVVVGDYGKGVISQSLLDIIREECRKRRIWVSCDPKPVHSLDLSGLSLLTPNRRELFLLAQMEDGGRKPDPVKDSALLSAAAKVLQQFKPSLLLVTLSEQGMLLCSRKRPAIHIPTMAREVFDVSGAGDTVIASFTLAVAAGASPIEAAHFSNRAAGIVVGKIGTATVAIEELKDSFL